MQVDIEEARTKLSRLLELVESGEAVVIERDGKPVAELVAVPVAPAKKPFPFDIARDNPLIDPNAGDEWWQSMTEQEAEAWINGNSECAF